MFGSEVCMRLLFQRRLLSEINQLVTIQWYNVHHTVSGFSLACSLNKDKNNASLDKMTTYFLLNALPHSLLYQKYFHIDWIQSEACDNKREINAFLSNRRALALNLDITRRYEKATRSNEKWKIGKILSKLVKISVTTNSGKEYLNNTGSAFSGFDFRNNQAA